MADSEPDTSPPADSTSADEDVPLSDDVHHQIVGEHLDAAAGHIAAALASHAAQSKPADRFAPGSGAAKSMAALKQRSS